MGRVLGPFIRARRARRNCKDGLQEVGIYSKEVLAAESQLFAFCRLGGARGCSGSRALIQQVVKAYNFWEFLEIGLLPSSSYSHTPRIRTCSGSLRKLCPAGCCSPSLHQKRASGAAVFCFGRKRGGIFNGDLVHLKLQDALQCFFLPR